jgi:DNA-binding NtrC family response regulator
VQKCLILAGDAGIGKTIATILGHCRWQTKVVNSALQAYDCINNGCYDTVIADIDSSGIGGHAVLAFCYHRFPKIATYAIARPEDEDGKAKARETGGCLGYYHLYDKGSPD